MSLFNFWKDPKDLFLEFVPQETHWRVVSWNLNLALQGERQWGAEVHGKDQLNITWKRSVFDELLFYKNSRLIRKKRISPRDKDSHSLMNLTLHSTLKYSLESNHEFMLRPVSGATTADFQNEFKALQWIQASFGTLFRALDQMENNSDLILTAACFSGKEPETSMQVLRVLVFNLDIFCYFLEDNSLQIAIFDDKNLGHGGAKTPALQQIIKVTKPQIYDEIVKLVHRIGSVGEIR